VPRSIFKISTSCTDLPSYRLKTLTRTGGHIRLSEDDGPASNEFLAEDFDEDNEHLQDSDDEPLSQHVRQATRAWRTPTPPEHWTAPENGSTKVLPTTSR